jgi:hypothetical protein
MKKIGTHNAATGEKGSFFSKLLTPFACCQCKTLVEQYDAGVRLFDIRLKRHNDTLYCYHGIWRANKSAQDLLKPLLEKLTETTYFELTYEGSNPSETDIFVIKKLAEWIQSMSSNAVITRINRKTPWEAIETYYPLAYYGDGAGFLGIHGWRCLLPIPWIWSKLHTPKLSENKFTFIDFA